MMWMQVDGFSYDALHAMCIYELIFRNDWVFMQEEISILIGMVMYEIRRNYYEIDRYVVMLHAENMNTTYLKS